MTRHTPQRGFIALISAIIISTVLLTLAVSIGSNTFFARFDALNREYKRLSLGFAESCVTTALGNISANYNYSAANVPVSLGTLYGKPATCTIASVSAGTPVGGKKTFTIVAKANFNNAFSTITAQATAQDPSLAPVTPPPTCALNPTALSVPGNTNVPFAWSTSGTGITSFTMDRGVGALTPVSSGSRNITAPVSAGTYTYTATVVNAGGQTTCNVILTVTPPPPAPACSDTVMIFDRTGSMSSSDLANERNAGNALTNLYATVSSLPKIGAGSFGGLNGSAASIPSNGLLTSSYSTILSAISTITGSNSSVGSNLGEAINVGAAELSSARHTVGKQKVLIFVSDGVPNEPTSASSANTGFRAPTSNAANNALTGDQWTNPAFAYGVGSTSDSDAHRHRYADFGFTIPTNATIRGIELATNAQTSSGVPVTFFSESFGTGSSINDIPSWDEEGNDSDSATLALAPGSGNDSASPEGGRFARIGEDEWICRNVNATGFSSLALSFFWRGDSDAESSDTMYVEYNSNGSDCNAFFGWNTIASDSLNDFTSSWSPRQTIALPSSLNNDSSFLIRFRVNSNNSNENLRVDDVRIATTPPSCNLGADLSWNAGTSWTSEKIQTLTATPADYTLGGASDTWGRTWSAADFSNGNFRARIRATASGATCYVDTLTARVSYTIPTTPSQYATNASQAAKGAGVSIFSIHYGDASGQAFMGTLASNSTIPSSSITTATRSGTTVTVTTASAHRLTGNQRVQTSGISTAALNGTFTVTSTPTPTTFTYTTSTSGTVNATGGSVAPTNLFISPASSAMTGIFQSIGYQICPAAAASCSNGVDDDGDGVRDDADGGCHTDGNAGNAASYDPNDTDEWTAPTVPTPPAPPPPPLTITIGSWVETP